MRAFFGIFGLIIGFLICGFVGGLTSSYYVRQSGDCYGPQCHVPIRNDCLTPTMVSQLNLLALGLAGMEPLGAPKPTSNSGSCLSLEQGVIEACGLAKGGNSGPVLCSGLTRKPS